MTTRTYDIIVAGGGPSGIGAAFKAAQLGKKVALIERTHALGGMATAAWMALLINRKAHDIYDMAGNVYRTIIRDLGKTPGQVYSSNAWDVVDIEAYKSYLEKTALSLGISLFYHADVFEVVKTDATTVEGIRVLTREGVIDLRAPLVIDATGDAFVAAAAGCEMEVVEKPQPMTSIVRMGGVDTERANGQPGISQSPEGYLLLSDMHEIYDQARAAGDLTIPRKGVALGWSSPSRPSDVFFNATRILGCHNLKAEEITRAETEARRQAHELVAVFKKYVRGFENAYLIATGPNIGVREARRIVGEARLVREDIIAMRTYDDAIAAASYAIDVHSPDGKDTELFCIHEHGRGAYQIPYRACIPKGWKGILAVGRCISADVAGAGSFRVQPTVMTIGEGLVEYHLTGRVSTLDEYHKIPVDIGVKQPRQ